MAILLEQEDEQQQVLEETPVVNDLEVSQPPVEVASTPEQPTTRFPAGRNAPQGASSQVDLSQPGAEKAMWDEYNVWWNLPKGLERDILESNWYVKYYGMTTDEVRQENRGSIYGSSNPLKVLDSTLQGLSAPGAGLIDFVMDAAGTLIPGFDKVDEKYDKATMLDNPVHQMIRRVSSIVLPTILLGGKASGAVNARMAGGKLFTKPWFSKLAVDLMTQVGVDASVLALSDVGEEHNAMRALVDLLQVHLDLRVHIQSQKQL